MASFCILDTRIEFPGLNVKKRFTAVIYKFSLLARVFVLGNPFQPSLMFAGKAGAYLSEAPFRCSTLE
jgi:hypothetical protein